MNDGTNRLSVISTSRAIHAPVIGSQVLTAMTFVEREDPIPTIVVATALTLTSHVGVFLQHLLVDDEYRRRGYATEVVDYLRARHGDFNAAWVSPEGQAFARAYAERRGDQPRWQVGALDRSEEERSRLLESVYGRSAS